MELLAIFGGLVLLGIGLVFALTVFSLVFSGPIQRQAQEYREIRDAAILKELQRLGTVSEDGSDNV